MVCKFCGNTIEDNSEFCFICGNKAVKDELPAEEVFAQPKPAEVPVVTADAPAADPQTVYTQQAPIYTQQTPIYAQQVYVQTVEPKKAKKAFKSTLSKAAKFFAVVFAATFILQFIPWIWYKNAKKAGYEEKATAVLNATLTGLCIFMAIICAVLIKTTML